VESYNKAVASLETRVLVSARKFHVLESTGTEDEIKPILPVEALPRELQVLEKTFLKDEMEVTQTVLSPESDTKADGTVDLLQTTHVPGPEIAPGN
jgi:hypothetical protein